MSSTFDNQRNEHLLRPGMRMYPRRQVTAPGTCSGVYGLAMADGGIVYIGKAANLNARLRQHLYASRRGKEGWYDGFCFIAVPLERLLHVEVAHVHALQPERNKLFEPPYWSEHAAVVATLRQLWNVDFA